MSAIQFLSYILCYVWFRDELINLKAGEEKKIKRYMALCICSDPIEPVSLEKLGNIKDLTVSQKTPIRVLHRRPLAVRPRIVHSMKAWLLENPTKLCKKGKNIIDFIFCCNFVLTCTAEHFEPTVMFMRQLLCEVYITELMCSCFCSDRYCRIFFFFCHATQNNTDEERMKLQLVTFVTDTLFLS